MKKLLLILLIMMCAQPVHAEELFDDKDLLLMEYMTLTTIWIHYVCDKSIIGNEYSDQKRYAEQETERFIEWVKRTYGKNWRTYIKLYLNIYEDNQKNLGQQIVEDAEFERSISLKDNLFCKHFLEIDQKTSEMFKK